MTITADSIEDLTSIVAGLVEKGLTFEARSTSSGWVITLTGGY